MPISPWQLYLPESQRGGQELLKQHFGSLVLWRWESSGTIKGTFQQRMDRKQRDQSRSRWGAMLSHGLIWARTLALSTNLNAKPATRCTNFYRPRNSVFLSSPTLLLIIYSISQIFPRLATKIKHIFCFVLFFRPLFIDKAFVWTH